jgi:hypothetical protein
MTVGTSAKASLDQTYEGLFEQGSDVHETVMNHRGLSEDGMPHRAAVNVTSLARGSTATVATDQVLKPTYSNSFYVRTDDDRAVDCEVTSHVILPNRTLEPYLTLEDVPSTQDCCSRGEALKLLPRRNRLCTASSSHNAQNDKSRRIGDATILNDPNMSC